MKVILRQFYNAAHRFPKSFTIAMGFVLLQTILNTLMPWALRTYLNQAADAQDVQVVLWGILAFAGYYSLCILISIAWYVSLDHFGGKYMKDLSCSLQQAMSETTFDEIEKWDPGTLRNILYTDVISVFSTVSHHIPAILGAVIVLVSSVILSFFYEQKVTLFICVCIGIGLLLSWCSRRALAKTAGQTNAKMKQLDYWCTQFIDLLPLVQQNSLLNYCTVNTADRIDHFIRAAVEEDRRTIFWNKLISSYNSLFSIALSAILAAVVSENSITNFAFFMVISNIVLDQAQAVEDLLQQIIKTRVSFSHVDQVLQLPKGFGKRPLAHIDEIQFEHVSFTYSTQVNGLSNVSYTLKKEDVIRLDGRNGSGKSTFIKLLTGLYSPTEGSVLINHQPISDYSRAELNRKILYISQEEKCLDGSFREYLETISHKKISDTEFTDLLHFVTLPEDSRTIRSNGGSLSVGQRKKLFVLKLLLRAQEADLIVLDELTSGLDIPTSEKVYQQLQKIADSGNKILILVDHGLGDRVQFSRTLYF